MYGMDQVPNGLGVLFGLAQLILCAVYYKSTKRLIAAREENEVSLSMVVVAGAEGEAKKTNIALQSGT